MRFTEFSIIHDVQNTYLQFRRDGKKRAEAVAMMCELYQNEITQGTEDDTLLFWVALADAQYKNKELTAEVAEQACIALEKIEQTDWDINSGDISCRKIHYAQAPMPEKRIGKARSKFRCSWEIGDTFAYRLTGPYAEERQVSGQYMLLRKVSDVEFGDGRLLPVVSLSLWDKQPLPQNTADFLTAPFLRLNSGRLGLPDDLYEYRAEIIVRSQKELNMLSLVYLGNFQDVLMPEDEVIIDSAGHMTMTHPKYFDRDFNIFIKLSRIYDAGSDK